MKWELNAKSVGFWDNSCSRVWRGQGCLLSFKYLRNAFIYLMIPHMHKHTYSCRKLTHRQVKFVQLYHMQSMLFQICKLLFPLNTGWHDLHSPKRLVFLMLSTSEQPQTLSRAVTPHFCAQTCVHFISFQLCVI